METRRSTRLKNKAAPKYAEDLDTISEEREKSDEAAAATTAAPAARTTVTAAAVAAPPTAAKGGGRGRKRKVTEESESGEPAAPAARSQSAAAAAASTSETAARSETAAASTSAAAAGGRGRKRKVLDESESERGDETQASETEDEGGKGKKKGRTTAPTPKVAKKREKKNNVVIYGGRGKKDKEREREVDEMHRWEERAIEMERRLNVIENGGMEEKKREGGGGGGKKGKEKEKEAVPDVALKSVTDATKVFVERIAKTLTHGISEEEAKEKLKELSSELKKLGLKRYKITGKMIGMQKQYNRDMEEMGGYGGFDDDDDSDGSYYNHDNGECDCCVGYAFANMGREDWDYPDFYSGERNREDREPPVETTADEKKKEGVRAKRLQQMINKAVNKKWEDIQKAHLVMYGTHLMQLGEIAVSTVSVEGEIPLSAIAMSMIPEERMKKERKKRVEELRAKDSSKAVKEELEELKREEREEMKRMERWWRIEFMKRDSTPSPTVSSRREMGVRMMQRRWRTEREAAVMFFSLAVAAGWSARLVCRCEVMERGEREEGEWERRKKKRKEEKDDVIEYWCELYGEAADQWIPINPAMSSNVNDDDEDPAFTPLLTLIEDRIGKRGVVPYIMAVEKDLTISNISSLYFARRDLVSREYRGRAIEERWIDEMGKREKWHPKEPEEEEEEEEEFKGEEMPQTFIGYKNHSKFVLDRDIGKSHVIYPTDVKPIGELKGAKIYLRRYFHAIRGEKWWEKMGRRIKNGAKPDGKKKTMNITTWIPNIEPLFGYWKTEKWQRQTVVNGRLPRNSFNNLPMFQPAEMCPIGGIYLEMEEFTTIARNLGKDFVRAHVGWSRDKEPILRGAVYLKSDLQELIDAFKLNKWREKKEKKGGKKEKDGGFAAVYAQYVEKSQSATSSQSGTSQAGTSNQVGTQEQAGTSQAGLRVPFGTQAGTSTQNQQVAQAGTRQQFGANRGGNNNRGNNWRNGNGRYGNNAGYGNYGYGYQW